MAQPMEEDGGRSTNWWGIEGWGWCPLCQGPLGDRRWPHIRVPFCGSGADQLCHFSCVRSLLTGGSDAGGAPGQALGAVDPTFAQDLLRVAEQSPQLDHRNPSLRICYEEQRLASAAVSGKWPPWPPPLLPVPPPAAFAFEGIVEIRISACPALRALPPEIGRLRGARTLVLISDGLAELPEEVASMHLLENLFINGNFLRSLPAAIGALPGLKEVCLDANLLEALPDFTSRNLTLFTAPGNKIPGMPAFGGKLDRLELHGNSLTTLVLAPRPPLEPRWDRLVCLKLMGNRLRQLPPELERMHWLRILMVASNQLEALPGCLTEFRWLEWFFAYDNQLQDLPAGLLTGSRCLARVLLEGNPLSAASTARLLAEAPQSFAATVGLDDSQVAACAAAAEPGTWKPLPRCVSVGSVVRVAGGQYGLKLTRASQLRRAAGVPATGEPGSPPPPRATPAQLLVVALSASQGEPEWMGLLRRLAERGAATPQPPPCGSLEEALEGVDHSDAEACLAALWAGCRRREKQPASGGEGVEGIPLGDFDVLSGVDHRMRWYSEDASAFSRALEEVCAPYPRVIFLGASMGGFGALRHGGLLGDAVLAFSPQANLPEASLRPPAADTQALAALAEQMFHSIRSASSRGALVSVHCAADEHFLHAMSMPLAHLELTVHPLLPRKPFARLLDRAGVLLDIVAGTVARLLQAPPRAPGAPRGGFCEPPGLGAGPRVSVARWQACGSPVRCRAEPFQLLRIFFSPGSPEMPRPGDWFCPVCSRRNMSSQFFCYRCGVEADGAQVSAAGTVSIPGHNYPQRGDWGCGGCGKAYCGYQDACTNCGADKWGGHARTLIVA